MAPIYTAKHVQNDNNLTPLFKLKGLAGLAPSPVSQLNIYGAVLDRQVAYTEYASNISAFILSSASNRRVRITGRPLGLPEFTHPLPLNRPLVSFTLPQKPTADHTAGLIRALGAGASSTKSGQITIFHAPAMSDKMASDILKVASRHFNVGRNAVNPSGYYAYQFLTNVFGELLRVHSYAAFDIESDDSMVEFQMLLGVDGTSYHELVKPKKDEVPVDRSRMSANLSHAQEVLDEMTEDTVHPKSVEFVEQANKSKGYISSRGRDTVPYARPPKVPVTNFGPVNSTPVSSGLLFPYFHGLTQPDSQVLLSFVNTHLFNILGGTTQECQDRFVELRRGINSLATHDVGMELSHIAFGLDLAINTQSRCFVLLDSGRYSGFVLLGARFALFDNTKWVAPESVEDLRDDLSNMDPHASAVKSLVSAFGEMSTAGDYKGPPVLESTFSEPGNLIEVFAGLDITKVGDRETQLNSLFRSLNYMGDGFLSKNPQAVVEVLETIFSDSELALARPTYIPDIRTDISTRAFIGLSRFGPEAPSFWNERGKDFKCEAQEAPVQAGKKRKQGDLDIYANLPSRILVTPKPLAIAVKDFGRIVERKAVRMDLVERAGKNRNMNVQAEEMRKQIWKVLVEGMAIAGNKRPRTEEKEGDEESGDVDLLGFLDALVRQ